MRQKKRHLSNERKEFVEEETRNLLIVGHIKEVEYPKWLANIILAPKPHNYTNLSKACLMDPFPLLSLDQMVDETNACELLSFIDVFKGYHHIFVALEDQEKTTFQTPEGALHCNSVRLEELRGNISKNG